MQKNSKKWTNCHVHTLRQEHQIGSHCTTDFTKKKKKRPEEKLRSLKLIPDLACLINSSAAEQINRELSSSRYSLCQMKDVHYMFSLRLFFHLHNDRLNCSFMKEMEKQSTAEAIRIGLDGKLICGQTDKNVKITNYTVTGNSFKCLPLFSF